MNSGLSDEHWRVVLELADAAADIPEAGRRAFLESHSSTPDVLREVLHLLEEFDSPNEETDLTGVEIGHFVLRRQLGQGWMGRVYSAYDKELGRTVAVKVLHPHSLAFEGAAHRFLSEAQTASALNHPNIVTIHEVIRSDVQLAIVMEEVPGRSLRYLCGQANPIAKVLDIGQQMADALAATHSAGVIHRDIKPENIMLRPDGRIKVLDFGLARSFDEMDRTNIWNSTPGIPAGTWRYMSPEQSKGLPLTGASDIFALGVVLYELLTGHYPFPEDSPLEVLQAITTKEVTPPSHSNPGVPPILDATIDAMLAKDPSQRPSAQAVLKSLQDAALEITHSGTRKPRKRAVVTKQRISLALSALILAAAATLAWKSYFSRETHWQLEQVTTLVPENRATAAAISGDGSLLAYANKDGVFLRVAKTGETTQIKSPADFIVDHLAWLGNGVRIIASGFSAHSHESALWSLSIAGGPVRELRKDARQGTPSPDGSRVAYLSNDLSSIWVMSADGSDAHQILSGGDKDTFLTLLWTPSGKHLLYQRRHYSGKQDLGEVLLDRFYERSFESIDATTGALAAKIPDLWIDSAVALRDTRVLFLRMKQRGNNFADQLWQVRMDLDTGRFHGSLERIASPVTDDDSRLSDMSATADGKQIFMLRTYSQNAVFVAGLRSHPVGVIHPRRLTLDEKSSYPHAWTSDSQSVIFESDRNGSWDLFKQGIDTDVPELVAGVPKRAEVLPQLSPDGKWILYVLGPPRGKTAPRTIMRVPVTGGPSVPVLKDDALDEFRCGLHMGSRCILRKTIGQQFYVFYDLDPVKGMGKELARTPWIPSILLDWDISPDGKFVALPNHDLKSAKIRILSLDPGPGQPKAREINLNGLSNLSALAWAADGRGWFVCVYTPVGRQLLFIKLDGQITPLGDIQGWAVPSPDGQKIAYLNDRFAVNAWVVRWN